jgi:hypothetical protein
MVDSASKVHAICSSALRFISEGLEYKILIQCAEIKGQLDATERFLFQNLLSAQHVSGAIMPIIRSSRVIQMVAACGTWRFGLRVVGLVWSYGFKPHHTDT